MQLRNRRSLALVAAPLTVAVGSAQAALPTEVTGMFTSITTDATAAMGLGWGLFAVVAGGFVIFKIVKKAVGKAT